MKPTKLPLRTRAIGKAARTLAASASLSKTMSTLQAANLDHAVDIHSFTTRAELEALMDLAAAVPQSGIIVEIGSYVGASTCFLAAGSSSRDAKIYCIDTWQNETMPDGVRDTYREFQNNLRPALSRIHLVRKNSEKVVAADLPADVDLVFIDGDHSYIAARHDFGLTAPLVKAQGVIAFHDVACFRGVSRVLGEALASGDWKLEGYVGNLVWIRKTEFGQGDVPVLS